MVRYNVLNIYRRPTVGQIADLLEQFDETERRLNRVIAENIELGIEPHERNDDYVRLRDQMENLIILSEALVDDFEAGQVDEGV